MVQVAAPDTQVVGGLVSGAQLARAGRLAGGAGFGEGFQGAAVIQGVLLVGAGDGEQVPAGQLLDPVGGHLQAEPAGQHAGGADRAKIGHSPGRRADAADTGQRRVGYGRGPPAAGPVRPGNQPVANSAVELPLFQAEIGGELDRAETPRRGHSDASGSVGTQQGGPLQCGSPRGGNSQ